MTSREVHAVRGPESELKIWPAPEVQAKAGPVKPVIFMDPVQQDRKK